MRNTYSHSHIWINGRSVSIQAIVEDKTVSVTEFEKSTFGFIREWISGKDIFTLQTSGSTGIPKEITVTRSQMISSARLTAQALELRENFNALICLDTRYIAGKMMIVRSLETAMKIFAVNPSANPLCNIPVDQTIHFTAFVPYQIKAILESKHPHLLDTLQVCIIGGGALSDDLERKLQVYTTRIYATYGMTETLSHIALRKVNGSDCSDFYQTLPEITIRVDNRNCLVIHVPYLEQEIVTNDIAEIIDKNKFKWLGRWDNVINSGGVKISAETLEEKIGKIFTRLQISNPYFIHGVPDAKLGEKVSLVIEAPLPDSRKLKSMHEALLHSFSPYEIPREFFESPVFVYTHTAKINRLESFKTARQIYPTHP